MMLKLKPWLFIALGTFSLLAQAQVVSPETRSMQGTFDAIDIAGSNQVLVTVGAVPKLEVSSQNNPALVITEVKNHTLYIHEKNSIQQKNASTPIITLTVPKLTSINTAGNAIVTVTGVNAAAIHVTTNGKSQIILQGASEHFYLQAKGKSGIDALKLKVKQATVETYGKSEVKLNVSDSLKVTIYGKANVYYVGTPKVMPTILGQGEIKPMS